MTIFNSYYLLMRVGSEVGPFPSALVANKVTEISLEGGHCDDDVILNVRLQTPPLQEEVDTTAKPQLIPNVVSVRSIL